MGPFLSSENAMADAEVKKAPAAPAAPVAAKKAAAIKKPKDIKAALKRGRVPLPKPKHSGAKLPAVPEAILKRRKLKGQLKNKSVQLALKKKIQARRKSRQAFRRAETYIKKYRALEKEQIRLKRQAKKEGTVLVPGEAKLAFVIRIRGINQIHPKVRKVLQLLRLRQINNAVFVQLNKATLSMLRIAEPFITWGYPNLKTIKGLLYKRGYGKVEGRRVPLTSNGIIERQLGKYGIICMEDMVHEIYTQGKNFTKVTNFLWNFKLNNPKSGWRMKTRHYVEGGDFGNREGKLNRLVAKMI